MAIWKEQTPAKKDTASFPLDPPPAPAPAQPRETTVSQDFAPAPAPAFSAAPTPAPQASAAKESLIASDITIEGKIEGSGHVRIAGKFKGDVNVQGDLTIETGAKLTGGVRANKVIIAGEVEGNIESAAVVELQASGVLVGDLKAGSLSVAAGSRMRGQADFGWKDDKGGKKSTENGAGA
ncbi:cytoskeletal protein CcmA (bactofilin family) [Luteimonas cucumeris]|uniref:Cytoskeletal protein CcmA (Bactofilin family) n=1 Tax=Luteimonas cucumeris TaxID=985012 RepID=A0A562L7H9_9GAMM|nr:polymer-forming cytoskeletal protein [Luteimonas cucumeris]TWI03637.1 cytoskeletal protein CcmA (bactofilin family) [Luteimonas cucumeris]